MNTKTIFTIVAIAATIGMLGIIAIAIPQAQQTQVEFLIQTRVTILSNTATPS
ncbi:MAG: hypothetical protein WA364_28425 [Candidatus Nitrosopolaris sp.]